MFAGGIWMRMQLRDYIDMSVEGSGAALLGLACLGALVAFIATLACCCTAKGHPALLYVVGILIFFGKSQLTSLTGIITT